MKIIAHTKKPAALAAFITFAIIKGEHKTWKQKKGTNGKILSVHSPESDQWDDLGVEAIMKDASLVFQIVSTRENAVVDNSRKGYIAGRFTEILLVHYKGYFEFLEIR